jgi:MoaA/NifB/PqqE/SkfB family radical SAM enzyme
LTEVRRRAPTIPLRARSTVLKANYRYLRETVRAAKGLSFDSISFLAADLTSMAFNRELVWPTERQNEIGLSVEDVMALDDEIELLITECDDELRSGFMVESPSKLRRIVQHFRAHLGMATPRAPICNAPWTSAVIELDGRVRPCFFHAPIGNLDRGNLEDAINGELGRRFRAGLDILTNPTCQRCVCSLNYRES